VSTTEVMMGMSMFAFWGFSVAAVAQSVKDDRFGATLINCVWFGILSWMTLHIVIHIVKEAP
jgi:hypothetical protein